MYSKLEQAIVDVLDADQSPTFSNVFTAYKGLCDKVQLQEAGIYFWLAMEKYPHATERPTASSYAALVSNLRKEHFENCIDVATRSFGADALLPCPCSCGLLLNVRQFRRQVDVMFDPVNDQPLLASQAVKKTNKRRRAPAKSKGRTKAGARSSKPTIDPFGPSTSRVAM